MRFVMFVFFSLAIAAVVFAADFVPPCANWAERFPTSLTDDSIPPGLYRLLRAHQKQGFTAAFVEEKRVTLLKRPLRSAGQLIFIPPYGLSRQLKTPFKQELIVTPTALHLRSEAGGHQILVLDQLPVAKAFVDAFLATFSGSWVTLKTHFEVFFMSNLEHWELGLKPIQPLMAKQIACLVLEGQNEQLMQLAIQETNGDSTVDRFYHSQLLPESTWLAYQPQFEWSQ